MSFSLRFNAILERQSITTTQLAKETPIKMARLVALATDKGKPTLVEGAILSRALNVSLDYLAGNTNIDGNPEVWRKLDQSLMRLRATLDKPVSEFD